MSLAAAMRSAKEVLASQMTEDELLSVIIQAAHARGWLAYHIRDSKRGVTQGDPGFVDLVLAREGHVLFLELKGEVGRVSDAQADWLGALPSAQVIRPKDLDVVLEWLR